MQQAAPRFSARLAAATGGNPFFILETLRALYEQGTLHRDEQGIWHTPWDTSDSDYQELPLPAELRQAIDGRLRELPPPARATLAAAAVLGQNFSPDTLARMTADGATGRQGDAANDRGVAPAPSRPLAPSSPVADQLLRGQFLVEERGGYRFGHNTLREVIYGELDAPTRQALHLRAAEVLEQEHYARVEALAQHLYLAGAWDKATPYLVQAGDHARAVCAYRDALRCYDQALAATDKLESRTTGAGEGQDLATVWMINLKRGEICALLSDYVEAARAYRQALILASKETAASRMGARRSAQIQALNGLGFVYGLTNEYDHARAFSRRAIALAAESPRLQDRAAAFYQAGQTGYHMNNYEEALTYLQQALDLYEAVDARDGQARCLERLAWIWRRQAGVTDQVIENLRRALAIYLELGDEYHEQHCRVSLANAYLLRGAFDEVLQSCDTVLPFFRASDARYSIAECQYLRGLALYAIGRLPEALAALDETVDVCQGLGIVAAVQVNRMYRGQVLRALGRYDEGQRDLEAACLTDDRLVRPRALSALAELWLDRGDHAQALEAVSQALTLVQDVGSQPYLGVALRVLGQVRAADVAQRLAPPSRELPDAEACFQASIELLETAQYQSDLTIAYAAYGRYLAAQGRAAEAYAALRQAQAGARRCGMAALLESLDHALQQAPRAPSTPGAGQVRVQLARQGTPRGRPLRPNEFVEVIWTIESAEYLAARAQGGKVAERHSRIRRLCAEALAQGAEPTVGDLADALGVNGRTVDRDIAALRATGELVVTRGATA
jgi:tetratricopeptide (TPR) repeat protein